MPIGIGTATAIGAAGALGGGLIAAGGAKSAARTQADAANRAADMQLGMFNTIRGDLAPYRGVGAAALPGYYALLGMGGGGSSGGPTYSYGGGGTVMPSSASFGMNRNVDPSLFAGVTDNFGGVYSGNGGGAPMGNPGFNPGALTGIPQYSGAYGPGNLLNDAQMQKLLQDRPDVGSEFQKAMANGSAQQRGLTDLGTYASDWYNRVRPTMGDAYALPAELMNPAPAAGTAATGADGMQAFLENTPGYKFTRDQGTQAVESALTARGLGGLSGSLGKGLARFVSGLADTTYQQQLDNYYKAVGIGQSAANQTGTFATQTGANVGGNIVGAGTALASGQVGAANALSGGFNGIGNSVLTGAYLRNGMYSGGGYATPIGLGGDTSMNGLF